MKCPACGRQLSRMTADDVTVDICSGGCGGTWFDAQEFARLEFARDSGGDSLLHIPRDPTIQIDVTKRLPCPVDGTEMMRHFESPDRKLYLDECPKCAGVWVDAGELASIRDEYKDDDARRAAADAYFDSVFGQQLNALRAKDAANVERAHRIAHMFRFMCPTYYIPGKQQWGAF